MIHAQGRITFPLHLHSHTCRSHLQSLDSSTRWVCYILDAIDRMGRNVQGWDGKGVGVMCLTGVNGVDGQRMGYAQGKGRPRGGGGEG